jgi:hypothetical protein
MDQNELKQQFNDVCNYIIRIENLNCDSANTARDGKKLKYLEDAIFAMTQLKKELAGLCLEVQIQELNKRKVDIDLSIESLLKGILANTT